MKKYTIYEIEKLTEGHLSKYKINKAIESGELIAEKLNSDKEGKGVPKCLVYEDDLYKWLQTMGDQIKTKIQVPDVLSGKEKEETIKEETSKIQESYERIIKEKDERIGELKNSIFYLENKNIPLIEEGRKEAQERIQEIKQESLSYKEELKAIQEKEDEKAKNRRKLVLELSSLGIFQIKKKREILSKLSDML